VTSLQLLLPGSPPALKRAASQWLTPSDLAARMVEWAGVRPGMRVLEPSAGDGSIVAPLLAAGADVVAVEADKTLTWKLVDMKTRSDFELRHFDFLQLSDLGAFDLAVMNPPYENGQDLEHVLHALEFAPRVVALLRLVFLAGQERGRGLWSKHTLRRLAVLSSRPRFRGDGDDDPKSDFALFDIERGRANPGPAEITWWP